MGFFLGFSPSVYPSTLSTFPAPGAVKMEGFWTAALLLPEQEEGHQPGFSLSPHKELQVGVMWQWEPTWCNRGGNAAHTLAELQAS